MQPKFVNLKLSPESIRQLDGLAERWGTSRSGVVERLVRELAAWEAKEGRVVR